MYPKFNSFILNNGLKLLFIPINNINNIATSLTFDIGYLEETSEEDGLAHLAEHLVSRYVTRNTKIKTLKSKGHYIYSNAHTNNFNTSYHIYSNKKFLNEILDCYYQLFNFNHKDSNLFKKELGAVIVELKQIISNKDKFIAYKNIPELIFGEKSKLVNDPIKEIKNLLNISEKNMLEFVKKHYSLKNAIITISGNIDVKQTLTFIKQKFNDIDNSIAEKRLKRCIEIPKIIVPQYTFEESKVKKLDSFYINFTCPTINDNKSVAITMILKKILVELNDSSILFNRLRTKLGIVYSPKVIKNINQYYGIFTIQYNIESKNYIIALNELILILNELKTKLIDDNLFKLAKNKILYEISIDKNDKAPYNFLYLTEYILDNQELLNHQQFYNKYTKHITLSDIKKWCSNVFLSDNCYMCVVGKDNLFKNASIKLCKNLG